MTPKQFGKEFRSEFFLEDGYIPVNHGSFGVYPKVLHSTVTEYRENAERHPDRWNRFQIKPIIEENYAKIAEFVHCDANELCFAANASNGVNTILRSFPFKAGDKIFCVSCFFLKKKKKKKKKRRIVITNLSISTKPPISV
jgi:selenocysteine lyase/cysteine desulfurase